MAERALAVLGDGVTADRARLLAHTGCVLGLGEAPFEVGDERLSQALAIADQLGDPTVRGHCLLYLFAGAAGCTRPSRAEAGLESAELLRAAGDLWGVASVLGWTTIGAGRRRSLRGGPQDPVELEPLAERLGNHPALMQARRVRAMVDFCTAPDMAALEAYAHADVEFVRGAGLPWFVHAMDWVGLARYLAGDWDGAREAFEEAVAFDPPSALNGFAKALLFEYLAYAGEREAALALLDGAADRLPKAGQPNGWGRWMMLLSTVEGLCLLGERDRAAGLYDLVVECIERTGAICPNYNDMRLPAARRRHRRRRRAPLGPRRGPLPHRPAPGGRASPPPRSGSHPKVLGRHAPRARRSRRPSRGRHAEHRSPWAVPQPRHAQTRGDARCPGRGYRVLIQPSRQLLSGTPNRVSARSRYRARSDARRSSALAGIGDRSAADRRTPSSS